MGWIIKIFAIIFLLAALHNWDLFCGTQICGGMTSDMSVTYMGYAVSFGFIAWILILYEVGIYYASRKDEEYAQ